MNRRSLVIPLALGLLVGWAGCSGTQGECSYDTDCPQLGYICDTSSHRCIVDPRYDDYLKEGRCQSDQDCDPIMQRCDTSQGKCVPLYAADPGPNTDGDGYVRPDNPLCESPTLDCSAAGLAGQGPDRDVDGWGECCDCDDRDPLVNPGKSELIYNGKDDDCNLETPDDDLDRDTYPSLYSGGSDCDDRNANVHPDAAEICDGLDNNCDGQIDPTGTCQVADNDPGDRPPECPDLTGTYDILSHCMQIDNAYGVELAQSGCNLTFNFNAIFCTGHVDSTMNLYIECAGLGFPCTAKASMTSSFKVICSSQCTFDFVPLETGTSCTFHDDPDCTANGQLCGVVGDNGSPTTVCIDTNPSARQPGYYCDSNQDIECVNSLCVGNFCSAICSEDRHCDPFKVMHCDTLLYDDGQGTVGNIPACALDNGGETRCLRTADCSYSRVCSFRQLADDVVSVCRPPISGGAPPGIACTQNTDCENGLCVCGEDLCSGSNGACSAFCISDSDCVQGNVCGNVNIPDQATTDHPMRACVRDTDSCGRDADCPAGKSCQVTPEGLSLNTICWPGGGQGVSNTGVPCTTDINCYSLWCSGYPRFCLGVCLSDTDCPTFDGTPTSCAADTDCALGYLCTAANACQRVFECYTTPFYMGTDTYGQPVWDTVNLCQPGTRLCNWNGDCRGGEACRLGFNKLGTAARMACDVGGPGTGDLGADCYTGGSAACFSGLCLIEGAGGQGFEYCSEACAADEHCGDPENWRCGAVRVDVQAGLISYIGACVRAID